MNKIYECPSGCHVSNKKIRCPRCDKWLLDRGKLTKEEVIAQVKERQIQANR